MQSEEISVGQHFSDGRFKRDFKFDGVLFSGFSVNLIDPLPVHFLSSVEVIPGNHNYVIIMAK